MNANIEEDEDAEEVDPFDPEEDDDDDDDDDAPENGAAGRLFGDLEELVQQQGAADVAAEQVIDGGMAEPPSDESAPSERKRSRDGELVLLIECAEDLEDLAPGNPITRRGVTVSIGLEKSTTLLAVFRRYCHFVNEQTIPAPHSKSDLRPEDLEFMHCNLLCPNDTAEAAALMKEDTLKVQKSRADEREELKERNRLQRESDKHYFRNLRLLLPDFAGTRFDVMLDCRGKLLDENGLSQEVLRTGVRAHSSLVSKRCKWLGRIIECAREEAGRKTILNVTDAGRSNSGVGHESQESEVPSVKRGNLDISAESESIGADSGPSDDDDDDGIAVLPYPINRGQIINPEGNAQQVEVRDAEGDANGRPPAAEIENDDDESSMNLHEVSPRDDSNMSSSSFFRGMADYRREPVFSSGPGLNNNMLWVTLPNHPPEAVRLLLEYCYTNRVVPLGQEAFRIAGQSKGDTSSQEPSTGPVPPFVNNSSGSRGWPNSGLPTVSLAVALSGISLAEEAMIPRLSLMCEVAASCLITSQSVLEALSKCTAQQKRTGNGLAILRKAAIKLIFMNGRRGVTELCRTPTFRRGLEDRCDLVVPSLLMGTREVVPSISGDATSTGRGSGKKRDVNDMTKHLFET
eukprot:scaffold60477_cov50-Attheya_sp.AAC.5